MFPCALLPCLKGSGLKQLEILPSPTCHLDKLVSLGPLECPPCPLTSYLRKAGTHLAWELEPSSSGESGLLFLLCQLESIALQAPLHLPGSAHHRLPAQCCASPNQQKGATPSNLWPPVVAVCRGSSATNVSANSLQEDGPTQASQGNHSADTHAWPQTSRATPNQATRLGREHLLPAVENLRGAGPREQGSTPRPPEARTGFLVRPNLAMCRAAQSTLYLPQCSCSGSRALATSESHMLPLSWSIALWELGPTAKHQGSTVLDSPVLILSLGSGTWATRSCPDQSLGFDGRLQLPQTHLISWQSSKSTQKTQSSLFTQSPQALHPKEGGYLSFPCARLPHLASSPFQ